MKIMLGIISFILTSSICFGAATSSSSNFAVCNQPFALCTTAPCVPVPGSSTLSTCSCIVQDGPSLGQVSCDKRKPGINSQGQHLLTSNYAFVNSATNKVMTCTGNHPWTDCLDQPCIIDPQNSNQAICTCPIKNSETFLTYGGECNTASCSTTLYSGATAEMINQGNPELEKAMTLSKSPMQSCPAT